MVKHIPLCPEALTAALWTRVWPLVSVYSRVNLEVLLLAEGLITAWKKTLEWLCPIMHMHVSLKANLSCECLTAAGMLTDKKLG